MNGNNQDIVAWQVSIQTFAHWCWTQEPKLTLNEKSDSAQWHFIWVWCVGAKNPLVATPVQWTDSHVSYRCPPGLCFVLFSVSPKQTEQQTTKQLTQMLRKHTSPTCQQSFPSKCPWVQSTVVRQKCAEITQNVEKTCHRVHGKKYEHYTEISNK